MNPASDHQFGNVHRSAIASHDYETALGHVMMDAVALQVVADFGFIRNSHVLIEHHLADFRPPADVAVVENDAVLHQRPRMHPDAAAEHRVAHCSPGKDA